MQSSKAIGPRGQGRFRGRLKRSGDLLQFKRFALERYLGPPICDGPVKLLRCRRHRKCRLAKDSIVCRYDLGALPLCGFDEAHGGMVWS